LLLSSSKEATARARTVQNHLGNAAARTVSNDEPGKPNAAATLARDPRESPAASV